MKVNQIKKIMDIKDSERMYFYNLLRNNLKKSLSLYIPSFSDNENTENISLYSLYPLLFRKEFNLTCEKLDELILFSHNLFSSLCDGASRHKSKELKIPENIEIMHIPPYTPEMNPIEQIRKQIRTTGLKKEIFYSLSDVEDRLCQTINKLSKKIIKRITHRDRIMT